jgi:hypothetical protein
MTEVIKEQRKALKSTITNAISAALSKNAHLKDKKVQKAIKNAASDVAKKIIKAGVVKTPSLAVKKPVTPAAKKIVKKVVKKITGAVKKPTVKRVVKPVVKVQ